MWTETEGGQCLQEAEYPKPDTVLFVCPANDWCTKYVVLNSLSQWTGSQCDKKSVASVLWTPAPVKSIEGLGPVYRNSEKKTS